MKLVAFTALIAMFSSTFALAASDKDIQVLRAEIQDMKRAYESRIAELESKLAKLEEAQAETSAPVPATPATAEGRITELESKLAKLEETQAQTSVPVFATPATARRDVKNNAFNPSIGIILNGQYSQFSSDEGDIAGFAVGHEGERPREGFAVDHTELNLSANVDDKFFGSTTAAIVQHGHDTEIELEEAYIQTLPDLGLPDGMSIKAGRAFWTLGYLNEHHSHTDDFADRPLPYRVFLDEAFNDDGAQVSYLMPTDLYTEIGAGAFRGDDFPFGDPEGEDIRAWSAFARIGGDIGENQSWRVGGYVLAGEADGERETNEHTVSFIGDTDLYMADLRYTWAPTGNAREQEVILQGEYFWREEEGTYEDTEAATGAVDFDESSSGWYTQAVYKLAPQWRVGVRYSQLDAPSIPAGLAGSALDPDGHDPWAYSAMADWTNSEFSRVRLQYNHEKLARGQDDDQVMVQYIMSFGAHSAHKY
uniref:Phosphate-selective porin O and P n=1 Tax=Candidatus Kentrum sp. FM TaxID=2126340 RepID=A0A450SXS5_9GAMM|nr:MAG: hypothetical protein BECKFM1743A_GA0114220_102142 [Candidatus Kentron sp. FM]VFJ58809.1 MAG: hypothetical protein BECKFM1743C_GA0114222_102342 [Candidatus Kentron sp. FM]VFK11549.1 MAG: hypothetical protein BECKFM1743B_GA0114221_101923 [Candidatus Kentron sp. FM]